MIEIQKQQLSPPSPIRPLRLFIPALIVSTLVHTTLFALTALWTISDGSKPQKPLTFVTVSLTPPIPTPSTIPPAQARAVPPSSLPEKEPVKPTQNRSERASATEEEMLNRDLSQPLAPTASAAFANSPSPAHLSKTTTLTPTREEPPLKPNQKKPPPLATPKASPPVASSERARNTPESEGKPPSLSSTRALSPSLRLNSEQLSQTLRSLPSSTPPNIKGGESQGKVPLSSEDRVSAADKVRREKLRAYKPFDFALPSGVLRGGGAPDLLPGVRDGEMTLLNAKADRYAVFVRRVGLQVFTALRRGSWQKLSASEIARIREFVTVHATMTPTGKLLSVEVRNSSGSPLFDRFVESAAAEGTWDRNPPQSAAGSDGNIHFIFLCRSWSQVAPNTPFERRWLLLSVGLL